MGKLSDIVHGIKDSLCTFSAPKMVEIYSWKLAVIDRVCILAVAVYIAVYQILLSNQYMKMYPVQAVFSVELSQIRRMQGLTDDNWWPAKYCSSSTSTCDNVVKPFEALPYCCSGPCVHNISSSPTACSCPWTVPGLPAIRQCIYEDNMNLGNTHTPLRQLVETFRSRRIQTLNTTCQMTSGCSKPWTNSAVEEYYIAGVEDYIIKMDHSITQSDLQLSYSASEMNGALWVEGTGSVEQQLCANPPGGAAYKLHPDVSTEQTSTAPCFLLPDLFMASQPGVLPAINTTDVFYMRTILAAAGYDLDSSGARANGGALTVSVIYANVYGQTPGTGFPQFGPRAPFYMYRVEGSFDSGYRELIASYLDVNTRANEVSYGIALSFAFDGSIGQFEFLTLTMVTVTGAALTGIASVLTNLVALGFLKHSKYYRRLLKDTGFSLEGEEELYRLDDKELNSVLAKMSLPQTGDRESKVLSILEARHHQQSLKAPPAGANVVDDVPTMLLGKAPQVSETPRVVTEYLGVLRQVHTRSFAAAEQVMDHPMALRESTDASRSSGIVVPEEDVVVEETKSMLPVPKVNLRR